MKRKLRTFAVVSGLLALLLGRPSSPLTAERTHVQVSFSLSEPWYRQNFKDGRDIDAFERYVVSQVLLPKLEPEIPFLRFGTEAADWKLDIRLGDPAASRESPHEVKLHLSLAGRHSDAITREWSFRSRTTWDDPLQNKRLPGSARSPFEEEVDAGLKRQRFSDLIQGFFEAIPVAAQGDSLELPGYRIAWLLPFKQVELCMDRGSELQLLTAIETPFSSSQPWRLQTETDVYDKAVDEEQRDRILCLPNAKEDLTRVKSTRSVTLKEAHVRNFLRMSSGCETSRSRSGRAR